VTASPTKSRIRNAGLWSVLLVCLAISITPILAPAVPNDDAADQFSVDRAIDHVKSIALRPHPMGTAASAHVREYLVETLLEIGIEPELQTVRAPDYFGAPGGTVEVTNVLARIPGTGDGSAILLIAHYDTVPTTPGANDNSAAVAALLEVTRVIATSPDLVNDVIVLFTDGEEPTPRYGASAFASSHPWYRDVRLAANFEGIGAAGPSMVVETSGPDSALVGGLSSAVGNPVAYSFMTTTADLIGGAASDFDVIHNADIPGFNFAFLRGSSIYHTDRDNIASINTGGVAHHGSLALGIVDHFGDGNLAELSEPGDSVFFTIPFSVVIRYPVAWGIAAAAFAAATLIAAVWTRRRRAARTIGSLTRGAGSVLIATLGAVIATTLVWMVLVNARPQMGVAEGYVYLAVLLGVLGAGWHFTRRWAMGRGLDISGGLAMVWSVLVLALGLTLPALGYLFVIPAIAAGIAFLLTPGEAGYALRLALTSIVAIVSFVVMTPAVDTFFLLTGPRPGNPGSELPGVIAVAMLLAFLTIGLVASIAWEAPADTPRRNPRIGSS
jgi:hypothetical protein